MVAFGVWNLGVVSSNLTTQTISKGGDMFLDLSKPEQARKYIEDLELPGIHKITFIDLTDGRRIDFTNMTDNEAILAANLLYDVEVEQELKVAKAKGLVQ